MYALKHTSSRSTKMVLIFFFADETDPKFSISDREFEDLWAKTEDLKVTPRDTKPSITKKKRWCLSKWGDVTYYSVQVD